MLKEKDVKVLFKGVTKGLIILELLQKGLFLKDTGSLKGKVKINDENVNYVDFKKKLSKIQPLFSKTNIKSFEIKRVIRSGNKDSYYYLIKMNIVKKRDPRIKHFIKLRIYDPQNFIEKVVSKAKKGVYISEELEHMFLVPCENIKVNDIEKGCELECSFKVSKSVSLGLYKKKEFSTIFRLMYLSRVYSNEQLIYLQLKHITLPSHHGISKIEFRGQIDYDTDVYSHEGSIFPTYFSRITLTLNDNIKDFIIEFKRFNCIHRYDFKMRLDNSCDYLIKSRL